MKFIKLRALLCIIIFFTLTNCSDNEKKKGYEVVLGGLYANRSEDGTYYISKILVIDASSVHTRTYANKYSAIPSQINSDTLDILIGHAPLALESFLQQHPPLIGKEAVKEEELGGYQLYLNEMSK